MSTYRKLLIKKAPFLFDLYHMVVEEDGVSSLTLSNQDMLVGITYCRDGYDILEVSPQTGSEDHHWHDLELIMMSLDERYKKERMFPMELLQQVNLLHQHYHEIASMFSTANYKLTSLVLKANQAIKMRLWAQNPWPCDHRFDF